MIDYQKYEPITRLIHDIENHMLQGVALENGDMAVANISRIAEYLNEEKVNPKGGIKQWRLTEIAKNAVGDTIGVKISYQTEKPAWVTSEINDWIMG